MSALFKKISLEKKYDLVNYLSGTVLFLPKALVRVKGCNVKTRKYVFTQNPLQQQQLKNNFLACVI